MRPVLVRFVNITFTPPFPGARTLSGLNLTVAGGEFFLLLAAEAGFLRAVTLLAAGLARPEKGELYLPPAEEGRTPVAVVFSSPGRGILGASVAEEVAIGLRWAGWKEEAVGARTEEVLRRFGLWAERDRPPEDLSGGEKQRLALAAALAVRPRCLVLEEPTAMLDPGGADLVRAVAREAAGEGTAVLWLSSRPEEAVYADRVGVLGPAGNLLWSGLPVELWTTPRPAEAGLVAPPLEVLRQALARRGLFLSPAAARQPEMLVEEICSIWKT